MKATVHPIDQALRADARDEEWAAFQAGEEAREDSRVPEVEKPAPEVAHLREVSLTGFMEADPTSIGYAFHPILPRGVVTLWTGHGGAGKSTAALTLSAHGGGGESWAGFHPDGMVRTVYASLEDPGDLVRYRLRRIAETFNLDPAKIEAHVRLLDCTSSDATLAVEENTFGVRTLVLTHLFEELRQAAPGADIIVIDNASDAFSGNENERRGVRTFMRHLADLARQHNAAVVLLAHIDKAAARTGSAGNSYSGSTAWHNSARSRIALLVQEDETVQLVHEKLNLGKKADPVRLQWNDRGVLVPLGSDPFALPDNDGTAEALAVLVAAKDGGVMVRTGTTGPATAWRTVEHLPEAQAGFSGKTAGARFHSALALLARRGAIERVAFTDANRNARERWELTQTGLAQAGDSGLRSFVGSPIPPETNERAFRRCVGSESEQTNATNATNAAAYRTAKSGDL